jgi:hypothetical protein
MGALGKHHLLSRTVHQNQRHFDFVASVNYSISVRAAQNVCSAIRLHLTATLLISSVFFRAHASAENIRALFSKRTYILDYTVNGFKLGADI